ncbi:DUF6356 family protein [Parvularcula lutaonensis]|uniref:DUF6356 family protein n=1 Tax=Parvularcula lutaonensis TaxID=491923 RepID=A0ABV7M7K3_9PROT|nr:DUF6356 family protein [Parvularcula lutaonensis]GGY42067.1 type 1 capsular polysaccharide biosynthesis protein J [Parvularcula lutaonensis]
MKRLFKEHPESVGETYVQHLGEAWSFAGAMILGGLCCFLHGLLPFFFQGTGSRIISGLHDRMVVCRSRADRAARAQQERLSQAREAA